MAGNSGNLRYIFPSYGSAQAQHCAEAVSQGSLMIKWIVLWLCVAWLMGA